MKILIVEDSERLGRSLAQGLGKLGYTVDVTADGESGLAFAESYDYDVIVLDLMLPRLSGLDVLDRLRRRGRGAHVLILSARDRVEDRVRGLQLGADDYLVKPFAFDELSARIQALVRRRFHAKRPVLTVGSLSIDTTSKQVFRRGRPVALTPGEYRLLELLVYQRGRVLSQEQLLAHLHHGDADVSANAVEVLVSGLRRKIHARGDPAIVRTRRGFGYVIE